MTNISFTCPHCGQPLDAPPEMAGGKFACPTCQKQIQVPTPVPIELKVQGSSLGGRLTAGLVGGFILAVLASNISSMLLGDMTAKEQNTVVTTMTVLILLGVWLGAIVFAIKATHAAKVWRHLLISNACFSFALPLAGLIMAGKAAHHFDTTGRQVEAMVSAGAGGIYAVLLGVLGFFLGAIFLTVGLLVGRDKHRTR